MKRLMAAACALLVAWGCGGETEQETTDRPFKYSKADDGTTAPLPADIFRSNPDGKMLPVGKTAAEAEQGPDGRYWGDDPRDDHPDYAFSGVPGDVEVLPGEFEPVDRLLIGWANGASELTSFFAETIAAGAAGAGTTTVYVQSEYTASQLWSALEDIGFDSDSVEFRGVDFDSIWMRDYGPLVVRRQGGGSRVIDTRYYYGRFGDDVLPTLLGEAWGMPISRPPLDNEGGNFQSDGAGRCITTEWSVEQNGYMGYGHQEIKEIYRDYLGCDQTLILPRVDGEGTGHVDMYATITGPAQVIVGEFKSTSDDPINASRLDSIAQTLADAGFTVRRIPMPYNRDGVFRSYTNSIAIGNRVLVPVYPSDRRYESEALQVFADAYPGRTIVPIDSDAIIYWAGAVHCITMTTAQ